MIALRAEAISKTYGGVTALDRVDFTVRAAAVNVLIGENGAGKSTLMRILAGVERPDAGVLTLGDEVVEFASVRDAAAKGIGIVFQELNLCPNLTVAQNIFLTRRCGGAGGLTDPAAEREATRRLMTRLEHDIDPDALVGDLKIGQQQIVEIAKALVDDVKVLILDEPTSSLSAAEVEVLFKVIAELRAGGVGVIYISHRLEELMRIGDYVTVLRDGRLQASVLVGEASVDWIVEQMLGERSAPVHADTAGDGPVVLSVRDLSLPRPAGGLLLDGLSLDFRAGEVVAVYGLLGSGRSELLETLAGLRRGASGVVRLLDEDISRLSLAERFERRLCLAPEDRQRDGLFPNLSVSENLALPSLEVLSRFGLIRAARARDWVAGMMARLGVKAASPEADIGSLSGGNQQKLVIGRCLMTEPVVLLLDEPSRGVDVGARAEIFQTIRKLAQDGLAVVFATSDMAEARLGADRVLVLAGGRLTADLPVALAADAALVAACNRSAGAGDPKQDPGVEPRTVRNGTQWR